MFPVRQVFELVTILNAMLPFTEPTCDRRLIYYWFLRRLWGHNVMNYCHPSFGNHWSIRNSWEYSFPKYRVCCLTNVVKSAKVARWPVFSLVAAAMSTHFSRSVTGNFSIIEIITSIVSMLDVFATPSNDVQHLFISTDSFIKLSESWGLSTYE